MNLFYWSRGATGRHAKLKPWWPRGYVSSNLTETT